MPDPDAVDHDSEGDDEDHEVPADLTILHEVLEYEHKVAQGPNES